MPVFFLSLKTNKHAIHHELFHWLELTENDRYTEDNPIDKKLLSDWNKKYQESVKNNIPYEYCIENNIIKRPEGYISTYANKSPKEDRAETMGKIFSQWSIAAKIIKKDSILQRKVEILTGCRFNPSTERFDKTYSDEEYKNKFGITKIFYATWCTHEFLNKAIERQK